MPGGLIIPPFFTLKFFVFTISNYFRAGWVQIKSTGIRGPCQGFSRFDTLGSLIYWILVSVSVVTIGWLQDRGLGVIVMGSQAIQAMSTPTAAMIPDPYRRWVKGSEYLTLGDEYSKEGTTTGIATRQYMTNARACGVTYASPLPPLSISNSEYDEEFWRDYLAH